MIHKCWLHKLKFFHGFFPKYLLSTMSCGSCEQTRMHSSRMRTIRCSAVGGGGGCIPACTGQGVSVRGGVVPGGCLLHTPPLDRMTDACEKITVKNHQKSRCGQIDATLVSRGKTFTLDKNENILFYRHSSSKVILLISFSTCNWKNLTTNRKWTEETSQVVQIHCLKHRKILFFTILLHQNHKLWQY